METVFKIGDQVKLKIGSPVMKVVFVIHHSNTIINEVLKSQGFFVGDVVCQWLNKQKQLVESTFSKDELILI